MNNPNIIIGALAAVVLLALILGVYFVMRSVKTAKGAVEKGFCGLNKIEYDYDRARFSQKNLCLFYVSVSMEGLKRLYSESKAARMHESIRRILLSSFCLEDGSGEIAPYGKENFVVFGGFDGEQAERAVADCFKEINAALVKHEAVGVVNLYFGCHVTGAAEVSFKTALARAKQAGSIAEDKKLPFCRWDSSIGKEYERRIHIENNINSEIENNRFFLEYQPILEAGTNRIIGAEVLSRLNSQKHGIVAPDTFLSAVNYVGLNEKFDYYIFEKVCKWIASDREKRTKYMYTVNFSRSTLADPFFATEILRITEKYGVDCACIATEIIEDKMLSENEKLLVTKNLASLKTCGVRILLDDFGKGYASFNDLTDLNIDVVKVDKTITQSAVNPSGLLILENIIRTAHELGFKTLCEGVETEEQMEIALDAGCDLLQGYYFYRPMSVQKFETMFDV